MGGGVDTGEVVNAFGDVDYLLAETFNGDYPPVHTDAGGLCDGCPRMVNVDGEAWQGGSRIVPCVSGNGEVFIGYFRKLDGEGFYVPAELFAVQCGGF